MSITSLLISAAHAQDAAGTAGAAGSPLAGMLPLVLIFVIFYFMLIRPQQKKFKAHQEMIAAIRRGDKVVTGGGIYGTVTKVDNDNQLMVEIAPSVTVKVARETIASVQRTGSAETATANDN